MKANILLHCRFGLLLLVLLGAAEIANGQGPIIDPTFRAISVYKPSSVSQAVQQPDGKQLLIHSGIRAGSQPAGPLVRLLANSNQPDSAFTSNVRGLQGSLRFVALLPNGKVLLVGYNGLSLGAVAREQLLLLNADGTPDAGFNANITPSTGYGSTPILNAVGQPDGKVVLVCNNSLLGTGILVRLLPNGAVDTAFVGALNSSVALIARVGSNVVVQADGKLVVPGSFGNRGVIRLLPTGALDPTFTAQFTVNLSFLANQVAVQSDGKVLVTTVNNATGARQPLLRLTDTGAVDPTFQSTVTGYFASTSGPAEQMQLQPDGKILLNSYVVDALGNALGSFVRLQPNGSFDPSFNTAAALGNILSSYTRLLPNGQILAVKTGSYTTGGYSNRLVLLNSDGSLDPSLQPRLFTDGQVNDVVQLPGGGYLVGGNFTEINGVAAGYLARLNVSGVPDPTFTVAADNEVRSLLVQPDGKLLVGGNFEHLAGGSRVAVGRVLPSGALDNGFAPPFLFDAFASGGGVGRVALLPDGRVLAAGVTKLTSTGASEYWLRVLDATTGQPDLNIPHYNAQDMVVQPNGKVVVAGFFDITNTSIGLGYCIFRLSPGGTLDPSFTPMIASRNGLGGGPVITSLAQSATGSLYCTGYSYIDAGPPAPSRLYALSPDGQVLLSTPDNRFGSVKSLAVQPNGRLLVGNDLDNATPVYGLSRLLSTQAPDPSFASANRPPAFTVNRLLVQPDGAIMVAGSFTSVGGQAITGLVRLLDANVLSVSSQQLAARTQAWPVPTHGPLHLALDAASRPQRVELLDALGRVALSQATSQAELTLDTAPLPAGVYVLRVQYATGPVSRRVTVE